MLGERRRCMVGMWQPAHCCTATGVVCDKAWMTQGNWYSFIQFSVYTVLPLLSSHDSNFDISRLPSLSLCCVVLLNRPTLHLFFSGVRSKGSVMAGELIQSQRNQSLRPADRDLRVTVSGHHQDLARDSDSKEVPDNDFYAL